LTLGDAVVQAVTDDWRTAPVSDQLKAMLGLLEKVTLTAARVAPCDIEPLLALGISKPAIEDALLICACFNIIARIADALNVAIPSASVFLQTAERLLAHGYI
jgi:alkylhydroperoxidase family enzyme